MSDIKDDESICTECNKKINDEVIEDTGDVETKWNLDAEPYCRECFEDVYQQMYLAKEDE